MRKILALSLGTLLVAGAAFAQEPAEVPLYFAVGIPSNALPTIDGDNSDWAWVDRSFEVTIEDMSPLTAVPTMPMTCSSTLSLAGAMPTTAFTPCFTSRRLPDRR